MPLSLTIKDEDAVKAALDQTRKKFGRIDVVVKNAGYTHLATIEEMSDARWERTAATGSEISAPIQSN